MVVRAFKNFKLMFEWDVVSMAAYLCCTEDPHLQVVVKCVIMVAGSYTVLKLVIES